MWSRNSGVRTFMTTVIIPWCAYGPLRLPSRQTLFVFSGDFLFLRSSKKDHIADGLAEKQLIDASFF